jgi:hypothetical protein
MSRILALVLFLALIGFAGISAFNIAHTRVENARHTVSMRAFCAMGDNAPIVRLDNRAQVEAYLYACHDGK